MMLRKSLGTGVNAVCTAAVLLLIASAGNAFGDAFTMTWTGPFGSGSAVLTATPDGTDRWSVTSLTGNQDGLTISIVAASVYGGNDNLIYQPTDFAYLVDRDGFDFTDGTNKYNIFDNNTSVLPPDYLECSSAVESNCTGVQADDASPLTSLTITPSTGSTVPEPTSVSLVGIMVLGAAAVIRRKYRAS